MTVLSGMTYREHLEENCAIYSPFKPLSEKELAALEDAAKAFISDSSVACNTCNYCMPCPYGLDIPGIFSLYNAAMSKKVPDGQAFLREYERTIPYLRRANHCTGCGVCLSHCPQSVDIPKEMRRIDELIESLKVKELSS
jgi:predicted aldo/keto reductase-like oxidoreductase